MLPLFVIQTNNNNKGVVVVVVVVFIQSCGHKTK